MAATDVPAAVARVSRMPTPQAATWGTRPKTTAGKCRGGVTSKAWAVITRPTKSRIAEADSFGTMARTRLMRPVVHRIVITTPFRIE